MDNLYSFRVVPGTTLDVTLAQNWRSLGESNVDIDFQFHGPEIQESHLELSQAMPFGSVSLMSLHQAEPLSCSGSFKFLDLTLTPSSEGSVNSLHSSRDQFFENRPLYELVLTYELEIAESSEITFRAPLLCDVLYDSEFESQLWMIYDSNKKLVAKGDAL